MAKAALQGTRDEKGEWRAVGIWFATPSSLQSRFLPGVLEHWVARQHRDAVPPGRDDGTPGDWEDWVAAAPWDFSNGHDLMCSSIEPELTLDLTYARYVLHLGPEDMKHYHPKRVATTSSIPLERLKGMLGPTSRA
jgi:hypothetical protein